VSLVIRAAGFSTGKITVVDSGGDKDTGARERNGQVAFAGIELPVADEMKVLGVVLDRHLTFEKQVMLARSCHYHAQDLVSDTYATYCQRSWHRQWRSA